eukprot:TRINITY_DN32204_c0_g1_i2.p1 TRINITY_DN32204_c0_g1~~TRINITY_DN32204_c0_g1_i2.p1  ORF type:complete len:543 (-),score=86.74 TRINITY_DN32204_c0_g1_i2:183-1811(-)
MAEIVKQILAKPIQLADQVTKLADDAQSSKQECAELKSKTEKLANLLRQAARASSDLYERPTRRIIDDTEQVLEKALALVTKCRTNGLIKRVFSIIPNAAFKKMSSQLENSIGDVSWLLRVSAPADDRGDEYLGLPPIAANEPILGLIWEQIATLHTGSLDNRSDAAANLVSLARDNDRYGKLIIEEGGIGPLLKLVKEGRQEGQENAARAIGLLARDPESVEQMIHAGVCTVFAKILKEGSMKVQSVVAWAVSEMASNHPDCQDHFAQNNIIRLLVSHLAFETVQEHSKYAVSSKALSIHSVVMANNDSSKSSSKGHDYEDDKLFHSQIKRPSGGNINLPRMHSVIQSTMEAVAEEDAELRRSAFKPNSPAAKAVVDQLLKIIDMADSDLLIPCIKAIGCLARTFRATETRIIAPLVRLLDEREGEVSREAAIALTKFACGENYLHLDHCKAIITAGGAKHLIQLVYFGEQIVQISSLILLCYIAMHVPDSEELAKAEVLTALEWASKQGYMVQNETVDTLLPQAKGKLELYQSRGSRGFH